MPRIAIAIFREARPLGAGVLLLAIFVGSAPRAGAQTRPATGPTTASAQTPVKLTVIEVVRLVRVRQTPEQPYQIAKVGMVLDEGAEFQTGPAAQVRIAIPPDQTVTIDRLTTCRVLSARVGAGVAKTDLGMQYGRTHYEVEAAGVEHDSTIRSPGSTLAVRGTRNMVLYDHGPFPPEARASQPVEFRNLRRQVVRFGQAGRTAVARGTENGPAETALGESREDPVPEDTRTGAENTAATYLFAANFTATGRLVFPQRPNLAVVATLPVDRQLQFQLRWFNVPLADLDFSVVAPNGRTIDINNPSVDTGMGTTAIFRGQNGQGNNGVADSFGFGQELIDLPNGFPAGNYRLDVTVGDPGARKGAISVTLVAIQIDASNQKDKPIVLSRTSSIAPLTVGTALSRTVFADTNVLREVTAAAGKARLPGKRNPEARPSRPRR